jgi:hypothetical protein
LPDVKHPRLRGRHIPIHNALSSISHCFLPYCKLVPSEETHSALQQQEISNPSVFLNWYTVAQQYTINSYMSEARFWPIFFLIFASLDNIYCYINGWENTKMNRFHDNIHIERGKTCYKQNIGDNYIYLAI